jgi:hypothetical protein
MRLFRFKGTWPLLAASKPRANRPRHFGGPSFQRSPQRCARNPNSRRRGTLAEFLAQGLNFHIREAFALCGSVVNFRLLILAEEILFLPLVGLFADMENLRGDHMPSLSAPAVAKIAVEEFGFWPQMILGQRFDVAHQLGGLNRLSGLPVERSFSGLTDIAAERRDRPYDRRLSRPPTLANRVLFVLRQFELWLSLKRIQEVERLHLVGVSAVAIETVEPFQ